MPPSRDRTSSFNSATDFCLWKCYNDRPAGIRLIKLQFGHRFLSVEIQKLVEDGRVGFPASIRPQIFVCGNSIEIRAFSSVVKKLQFGHRFLSVEIQVRTHQESSTASLQFGHRFLSVEMTRIGPLIGERFDRLQFGHRFLSVEMQASLAMRRATSRLQFGHRFLSVEMILPPTWRIVETVPASIRPQIFVCGNGSPLYMEQHSGDYRFNSATDFCLWKSLIKGEMTLDDAKASIRPQIFVCGNAISQPSLSKDRRFNSATDFCLWKSSGGCR
ncbi:unnamed protein product [Tuwongella immobilis]|uniref:Uncharacterized protein n=1 Tax=Tuwongella immobilis TaxID=692036 RepID=A0A6C2YWK0_9BACT|nr:unnamed protein product [Tuwongella immobilis]VTS07786.1 unnamed protein product [Tuwongella immobilis]